jgi:hypothetical protein
MPPTKKEIAAAKAAAAKRDAAKAAKAPTTTVNTNTLEGIAAASGTPFGQAQPAFRPVDPNAPRMFVGPIPTGSTRTETGFITAEGGVVNP